MADGGDVGQLNVGRGLRLHERFFLLGINDVFVSNDSAAWNRTYVPIWQPRGIAFGNGRFVVAGAWSLRTSSDGTSWEDHAPPCTQVGAPCVQPPCFPGTTCTPDPPLTGPYQNLAFLDDRFYVDHLMSTDAITWQAYGGPIVNEVMGGYAFNYTADDPVNPSGVNPPLRSWRPGESWKTITIEPAVPSTLLAGGVAPTTITTPLPGGETCLTHRCVIVGGALYLIR